KERCQLLSRFVRRHPVVGGTAVVAVAGADERKMLGARDVVRRAAVQITAWQLVLIQLDQLTGREALSNQLIAFGFRPVAVDHAMGGDQPAVLVNPLPDGLVSARHRLVAPWRDRTPNRRALTSSRLGQRP